MVVNSAFKTVNPPLQEPCLKVANVMGFLALTLLVIFCIYMILALTLLVIFCIYMSCTSSSSEGMTALYGVIGGAAWLIALVNVARGKCLVDGMR